MLTPSKALGVLTGIAAALLLIIMSCSNTGSISTDPADGSTAADGPGDPYEIGPDQGDDDFQHSSFTFSDDAEISVCIREMAVGPAGGTITVTLNGQDRHFTFPVKLTASAGNVRVAAQAGINLNGDILELYDLYPPYVAYTGPIQLQLETSITNPSTSRTQPEFTLYRLYGGVYSELSKATPDATGLVCFALNQYTSYAVIYDAQILDDFVNVN